MFATLHNASRSVPNGLARPSAAAVGPSDLHPSFAGTGRGGPPSLALRRIISALTGFLSGRSGNPLTMTRSSGLDPDSITREAPCSTTPPDFSLERQVDHLAGLAGFPVSLSGTSSACLDDLHELPPLIVPIACSV